MTKENMDMIQKFAPALEAIINAGLATAEHEQNARQRGPYPR